MQTAIIRLGVLLTAVLSAPAASAEETSATWSRFADTAHGPAFEVNVLWPFFPGGLTDLKLVLPVLRTDKEAWRGEAILGLHSDFGWRIIREEGTGRVAILAMKLGYRQFLGWGFHVDVTANVGWRQERGNVYDGTTLNGLVARLWPLFGWQVDLSKDVYMNLRGGPGIHLFRTDRYADKERPVSGGADLNIGLRL